MLSRIITGLSLNIHLLRGPSKSVVWFLRDYYGEFMPIYYYLFLA